MAPLSPTGAVVVTGASSGIGAATALRLEREGHRVYAGVRRKKDGEALKKQASDRLQPIMLDVTEAGSLAAAAERVSADVGDEGLAALVNNAGIAVMGPLEFLPLDRIREQLEVNVVGVIAATQAFLPLLRRRPGRIVNVGSLSGLMAAPFLGAYSASKFALEGVTDALRMELSPWNIRVSIVEPSNTATPIWKKPATTGKALAGVPARQRALYKEPLERMTEAMERMSESGASPDEVAAVIGEAVSASSPKARYYVGAENRLAAGLVKMLPDWAQDSLVMRVLGQGR